MNILIADDNELNLYQLQALLSAGGHQVVTAVNGAEALGEARRSPPDLIVTDVLMPVMDGFALCREWMRDERLKHIPLVFYSASYTDSRDMELALDLGAARFLLKPAEPEEFIQAIRDVLEMHERGELRSVRPPVEDATVYLRHHNEALIRRLEAKMEQLAQANRDLEREIAERKRNEEEKAEFEERLLQAQKLESVGRLAGGVAHDFNNLLTVINGYSDLILGRLREGDPLRKAMAEIRKAGERAADLTRQLLAFSRKQIIQPRLLNLNDLVNETHDMLRRLIGEDVEVVTTLAPALGLVMADPGQLHQVLVNLAVNARDAMPGGGRLRIETADVEVDGSGAASHPEMTPGSYVLLAVSDTGAGMDEETRSHIFEPFFTTKGVGQGTGLGLSTVYGIVKQSQGSIAVSSGPGHGTTFRIYLPRVEGTLAAAPAAAPAPETPRGAETVLVVEDQEGVRRLLVEVLETYGYRVLEAGQGGEALRVAEQHAGPIHLLLTDVVMPGMTGRELAERLTPLRPEMKVLYLTGYTAGAIAPLGVLAPGVEFIQKPILPSALAMKIREVLGSRL